MTNKWMNSGSAKPLPAPPRMPEKAVEIRFRAYYIHKERKRPIADYAASPPHNTFWGETTAVKRETTGATHY